MVVRRLVRTSIAAAIVASSLVFLFRAPATGGASFAMQSPGATPRPSGSSSPSPTPSASASASPPQSPSSTDPRFDPDYRRSRLFVSQRNVPVGRRVVFSGTVDANRPECRAASSVLLKRLIFGTRNRLTVDTATTDSRGQFRMHDTVRWSALY